MGSGGDLKYNLERLLASGSSGLLCDGLGQNTSSSRPSLDVCHKHKLRAKWTAGLPREVAEEKVSM